MAGKVKKTQFQKELLSAVDEKSVEAAYRKEFGRITKTTVESPYHTDGILIFKTVRSLLELKKSSRLKDKKIRCSILMQALFYLHNIEQQNPKLSPSTIFIGDEKECFFIESKHLHHYLRHYGKDINWDVAPSDAYLTHPVLLKQMMDQKELSEIMVMAVQNETFRLSDITEILENISENIEKNETEKLKLNEKNLISAFQYFQDAVIRRGDQLFHYDADEIKTHTARLIDVFYNLFTNDRGTVLNLDHGVIVTHIGEIQHHENVHPEACKAFFSLFDRNYTEEQKQALIAIKDRILEEMMRRRTGAYFTPDIWIAKAHEMIAEQFGSDWKEKYVVWDCASGTNNLTRNYPFKELYNSTLEQGDVDTVNDMGYPGTTFQYDFLNDDENKLKEKANGLFNAIIKNKPIIVFINPPYGTAKSGSIEKDEVIKGLKEDKKGIANTKTNDIMKKDKIGACSQQLYAQFLYAILKLKERHDLTNIKICIFSAPLFMSGEGYVGFRNIFYKHFNFKEGMIFRADQFADVSSDWAISFTLWDGIKCN